MSKMTLAALVAAAISITLCSPAAAQGGFLKNLARQAAAAAIQNAATPRPQDAAAPSSQDAAPADEVAEDVAPEQVATSGPAPWPLNVGARSVTSPTQLEFSPETQAAKKAFVEFSKVRCNDCEGGYSYDAWAQHHVKVGYEYNAFHNKIGGLAMGQSVTWTGSAAVGSITVVGETPIRGWRCKQLKWELKKGAARAERPDLYCVSPSSVGSAKEQWLEVF